MSYFIKIFWIIWNFWFKLPDKIRFLLVGGFNALVQYLIYISFLYFWSEDKYQTALILSWIISSFSSFATQKIFVFCTKGKFMDWIKEYIKCLGVWVVSYTINAVILEILVNYFVINPYLSQIIISRHRGVKNAPLFLAFCIKTVKIMSVIIANSLQICYTESNHTPGGVYEQNNKISTKNYRYFP